MLILQHTHAVVLHHMMKMAKITEMQLETTDFAPVTPVGAKV